MNKKYYLTLEKIHWEPSEFMLCIKDETGKMIDILFCRVNSYRKARKYANILLHRLTGKTRFYRVKID